MKKSIESRFETLGYYVFWQAGAEGQGYYIQSIGSTDMTKIAGNKERLEEYLVQLEEKEELV